MAKVTYKSAIPNDKPWWLLNVQHVISQKYDKMELDGNQRDFENLKTLIDEDIAIESRAGRIRSEVTTEIRTDEGKTVLHIFRGGTIIQTYSIE